MQRTLGRARGNRADWLVGLLWLLSFGEMHLALLGHGPIVGGFVCLSLGLLWEEAAEEVGLLEVQKSGGDVS